MDGRRRQPRPGIAGDTLINLPHPSTTQRAAVQMLSRELRAGPPAPMVPVVDDDMPAEPAVEPSVDSAVVDTLTRRQTPSCRPRPLSSRPCCRPARKLTTRLSGWMRRWICLPWMRGDENLAELPPAEMAWPAQVLPHEQAAADLAAGDVDLAEMLAELPALTDAGRRTFA